jgi:hypothetical protein
MNINKQNYEQHFFDLVEGNLNETERKEVMAFVHSSPELLNELELFQNSFLDAGDAIVFEGKEQLKKGDTKIISLPIWRKLAPYSVAACVLLAFFMWMNKSSNQKEHLAATEGNKPKEEMILPAPDSTRTQTRESDNYNGNMEGLKTGKAPSFNRSGVRPKYKRWEKPAPRPVRQPVAEDNSLKAFTYDTSGVIKKDIPAKILIQSEQPVLAIVDSVKTPQVPDKTHMPAYTRQHTHVPLKDIVEGRLENLLGYFTKPKMKIEKVKVDEKTRYIIHLENQKLKLVAGL